MTNLRSWLQYIRKHSRFPNFHQLSFIKKISKKLQQSLTEKMLKFNMTWHFFSNHQNKVILFLKLLNTRTWITLNSSVVIFQALETSLTSVIFTTSLASTAQFPQKTSWSWWSEHLWHQNEQYWSLFVEWIIKNPILHRYLVPSLLEAVEASLCNFLNIFWWNSNGGYLGTCQPPWMFSSVT